MSDPYGGDPQAGNAYGSNPYGGDPQAGNPYGPGPYGGNPYGGNPYGPGPYGGNPYGPYGPGQGTGPLPWGGPPGGPGKRGPGPLVIALIAVLAVVVLALGAMLFTRGHGGHSASGPGSTSMVPAGPRPSGVPPRSTASAPPTTRAGQSAKDCTPNVQPGRESTGEMISAGGLSFPASVAPGWSPMPDGIMPNAIDSVAMTQTVAPGWGAQISVGITNFDQSMSLVDQANLMLKCVVASKMYSEASPRPGTAEVTPGDVDGVTASRLSVAVKVSTTDPGITGDDVVLIIVDTKPSTFFLGVSPIGDAARGKVVKAAAQALKVTK